MFDGYFEVCEVIGRHEMREVSLLKHDKPEVGIRITYGGGTICESEMPFQPMSRSTSFELLCDSKQEDNFALVMLNAPGYVTCDVTFRIKTPAGCPVSYQSRLSWIWMVLIWGLALSLVYFIGGYLYNRYKHGKEGMEALPHSEFWFELKEKVSCRFRRFGTSQASSYKSPTTYDTI